ncbi:MAG: SufE family protein [Anaerolineae bacterium]|nr:SufE family protein [Anaerolineae bacterium]
MSQYPPEIAETVEELASITDRQERAEMLIEIADRFSEVKVTPDIATKPYDEAHRVPACESEAFVWAQPQADGTLRYYFDVLNPQGLSAMAMSVVLGEALNGQPAERALGVPSELVFDLFGREISMGKGAGLMGILSMVQSYARRHQAGAL